MGFGEARRAQQRLVGGDRARGHRSCRDRIGEHGPARRSANRAAVAGDTSAPQPATSRPRMRARAQPRSTSARAGARVAGVDTVQGRPSVRPGASTSGAPVGTSGSRNGRLRCTGPGRQLSDSATARHASARQTAPRRVGRSGGPGSQNQRRQRLRRGAADRLSGPHPVSTKFGRPVGRAHQQRHPRVRRLDHGRVEVRGRGPRRAQDHDRAPAREGDTQCAKRGRTLVEHYLVRRLSWRANASARRGQPGLER